MLSCCKCIFEEIGANLAHIQPENLQNVQKMHFWQKALGFDFHLHACHLKKLN